MAVSRKQLGNQPSSFAELAFDVQRH